MTPYEMSTADLVSYIKGQGFTPQTGYGQFVKHRALRPEISMLEFRQIWERVTEISPKVTTKKPFKPTYELVEAFSDVPKLVIVTSQDSVKVRWFNGVMAGSTPRQFIVSLKELND